jgi:hypothetical protein
MKAFGPSAALLAARYLTGAQPLLVSRGGAGHIALRHGDVRFSCLNVCRSARLAELEASSTLSNFGGSLNFDPPSNPPLGTLLLSPCSHITAGSMWAIPKMCHVLFELEIGRRTPAETRLLRQDFPSPKCASNVRAPAARVICAVDHSSCEIPTSHPPVAHIHGFIGLRRVPSPDHRGYAVVTSNA